MPAAQASEEGRDHGQLNQSLIQGELLSLKRMVINSDNLGTIKNKLIATAEHRTELLKNKQLDLRAEFPYFFICVDLVCLVDCNHT